MSIPPKSQTASYAVGSLNELFSDTMRLNTTCSGVESFASTQKNPWRTNWKAVVSLRTGKILLHHAVL